MSDEAIQSVMQLIEQRLGIQIPEYRHKVVRDAVYSLAGTKNPAELIQQLESGSREHWAALIHDITIPETFLFRHKDQFDYFESFIRSRLAENPGTRIRVLSAGCSTGEEAWSIAAICAFVVGTERASSQFDVVGLDLDQQRILHARKGVFSAWQSRKGVYEYSDFFTQKKKEYIANKALHQFIRFEQCNLLEYDPKQFGSFDVIFFRNVAIYWPDSVVHSFLPKLIASLKPNGLFVPGPSDHIQLRSNTWKLDLSVKVPVYIAAPSEVAVKAAKTKTPIAAAEKKTTRASRKPKPKPRVVSSTTIQKNKTESAPIANPEAKLSEIRALADQGKYTECQTLIEQLGDLPDSELRILEGIVLLNLNEIEHARRAFEQAVFLDSSNSDARRWLIQCYESLGDVEAAERAKKALEKVLVS